MTIQIASCYQCKHKLDGLRCKAFEKIPSEIIKGDNDHRKPYPGDNGIQFEALDDSQD